MKKKRQGHYCRVCGEYKANEKFSGKGHAAHICKACASKSPEQKSEDMTINKSVDINYKNGTEQNFKDYDSLPDPVMELHNDFNGYFEEDLPDEDFDYDEDE